MCGSRISLLWLAQTTFITLASLAATGAWAATITVTGTGDTVALDGLVTLREALAAANNNAAAGDAPAGSPSPVVDLIKFNISGLPGTVHTITPGSVLPTSNEPVFIDGYSQLGASVNTAAQGSNAFLSIELVGTSAGFNPGLVLTNASTVQGLVIRNFNNEGLLVLGSGNVVRGNFLGTDATGKLDRGNGISGITLLGGNNRVGGKAAADRNLISGNEFVGVLLSNSGAVANRIEGNLIGTDDTGATALGNGGSGVRVSNSGDNEIGGLESGAGNTIAYNVGTGVTLLAAAGTGNTIVGNAIFGNGNIGIDLGANAVTLNDVNDTDAGPNGGQNFPVLLAEANTGTLQVAFDLDTPAAALGQPYAISVYSSATCDGSGFGEGERYLGTVDIIANAAETYAIALQRPLPQGHRYLVATATDPGNSTSEFSACFALDSIFKNGFD